MTNIKCKAPDCNCDGRGCWAREQSEAAAEHVLSPANIEAVARAYCRRMGLDPDEPAYPPLTRKLWEEQKSAVREAIAMRLAIMEVMG